MGNGVNHPSSPLLVGLENQQHIGERRVGHDPGGTQGVSTVNDQITDAQFRRQANHLKTSLRASAEPFSKLRYREVSQGFGHPINGAIWP